MGPWHLVCGLGKVAFSLFCSSCISFCSHILNAPLMALTLSKKSCVVLSSLSLFGAGSNMKQIINDGSFVCSKHHEGHCEFAEVFLLKIVVCCVSRNYVHNIFIIIICSLCRSLLRLIFLTRLIFISPQGGYVEHFVSSATEPNIQFVLEFLTEQS